MSRNQNTVDSIKSTVVELYDELRDIRNDAVDQLVDGGYAGANRTMTIRNLITYLLSLLDLELEVIVRIREYCTLSDKLIIPTALDGVVAEEYIHLWDKTEVILPDNVIMSVVDLITSAERLVVPTVEDAGSEIGEVADKCKILLPETIISKSYEQLICIDECRIISSKPPGMQEVAGATDRCTIITNPI